MDRKQLIAIAYDLNQKYNNYAVSENARVVLTSAVMLALQLQDPEFSTYAQTSQELGKAVTHRIDSGRVKSCPST